jgi:rhomboid protease GluP
MTTKDEMRFPIYTLLLSLSCIAIFVLFQYLSPNVDSAILFSKLGAPYAVQIYIGQYWGVFTNSFLHINTIHLLINLLALWVLGSYVERRIRIFNFFLIGLFASSVTSMFQLTLTNDAGIGLSGVNYFLLSFILIKAMKNDLFKLKWRYVYGLILLLVLPISYYLNTSIDFNIGIEAMLIGILLGCITGWLSELKSRLYLVIFIIVIMGSGISTLFYSPWSAEWNYTKGYSHDIKNEFQNAKKHYRVALEIDPKHKISRENLRRIRIEELCDLAMRAHENEDYLLANEYYQKVLAIDPWNKWARENIKKLP